MRTILFRFGSTCGSTQLQKELNSFCRYYAESECYSDSSKQLPAHKRSYKLYIDYIITKSNNKGIGKNNEKIYMLTPDCAKMILQSTKSKKGAEVRRYFIEIEKMLYKY